jgi:hypothetical protein
MHGVFHPAFLSLTLSAHSVGGGGIFMAFAIIEIGETSVFVDSEREINSFRVQASEQSPSTPNPSAHQTSDHVACRSKIPSNEEKTPPNEKRLLKRNYLCMTIMT